MGFGGQKIKPTGMILLPLRFRDKVKARNIEVDFLLVTSPWPTMSFWGGQLCTSSKRMMGVLANCMEITGWPEHAISSVSRHLWNRRPSVFIIIGLLHRGPIVIVVVRGRPHHLDARYPHHRKDSKVHQPWILALNMVLVIVFDVLHVGFKVALFLKVIGCQGLHELSKELRTILVAVMITLPLSRSHPLSSHSSLNLNVGMGFFQLTLQIRFLCISGLLLLLHLLQAPLVLGRLVKERKSDKEEKSRERLVLISAMATCSSMTLGGSAEQEGARAQDLARLSTKLQPSRVARMRVPIKSDEVEDKVEGEVEDTHNPFEDSKKECEDATVNLKEDKQGAESLSLSLSRKPVSL
ncbi:hypothetical protein Cgig2_033472 [Carnegiea gigantea]|uniref:Uncharacterized protein n=1 Tax=Carnegiea gigantea TaxID=171969 RepID=A0A9Q1GXS9_9CARY|nr:hypothetical protein Cgig2_033472 [Carnegiea gigantea]